MGLFLKTTVNLEDFFYISPLIIRIPINSPKSPNLFFCSTEKEQPKNNFKILKSQQPYSYTP